VSRALSAITKVHREFRDGRLIVGTICSPAAHKQRARCVLLLTLHLELGDIEANDDATGPAVVTTLKSCRYAPAPTLDSTLRLQSYKHLTGEIATGPGLVV